MSTLKKLEGSRLAVIGLAVAAVLFLAVNVFANAALRSQQLDLTEGRLFTLSEGTVRMLESIDEPIHLRLYFSRTLGEAAPVYETYQTRVRELLERYVDVSTSRIRLELLDPEPFSSAEDRAVADGLQGVPLNAIGDLGYFGLAGSNSVDGHEVIPFFNREREPFLEYDVTKLIHRLATPDRPVVAVLSGLQIVPPSANSEAPLPGWVILDQVRDFFELTWLNADAKAIPDDVDVLMVLQPADLGDRALFAVDQYVLGGGPALVFADPNVESPAGRAGPPPGTTPSTDVNRLLRSWGVEMVDGYVAGDVQAARRVSTGPAGGNVVASYLPWLSLGPDNIDRNDPIMANVETLNLATAGVLMKAAGATTTVMPLVFTSPVSNRIAVDRVRMMPDVAGILRDFQSEDRPLTMAVRITGEANSAFPDGPPPGDGTADETGDETDSGSEAKEGEVTETADKAWLGRSTQPINVIVVADTDILFDQFWVNATNFMGQQVFIPLANNSDFVINALENLSGNEAFIGLRGRGFSSRPFEMVEEIEREAELRYRAEEQRLQDELSRLQAELEGVRRGQGEAGTALLTAEDRAAIDRFRAQMVSVRKELRGVRLALRQDIEGLESRVKFINIAAVPLLIGIGVVVILLIRYFRRSRPSPPHSAAA